MTELKPCPFCGGEAGLYHGDSTDGYIKGTGYVEAFCGWCGARIRKFKREDAIEKWNTRPNPWHNAKNEIPMANTNLILHIMSDEDDTEGYYQSGYYEHGRWIKWNGCGMTLCCGEYVDKWSYEKE